MEMDNRDRGDSFQISKGLYEDLRACQKELTRIVSELLPEASQEVVKAVEEISIDGRSYTLVNRVNELMIYAKLGKAIDILAQILDGEGTIRRPKLRGIGEVYLHRLIEDLESLANDQNIGTVAKGAREDSLDRSLEGLFSKHQTELQRLKESPTDEALKLPQQP
jgi:hypothetical protein